MTVSSRRAGPGIALNNAAMAIVLILMGFPGLFISPAEGETTYCAFEVKVSAPSGVPIDKVPVVMIRGDRTTFFETATTANGVARICDAPLESVDIVVGFDVCGSVLIRDLKPSWPKTQRVFVTYVRTFCDHFGIAPGCQVLLRVQDGEGRPVAGARFDGEPSGTPGSHVSDALGRLFRSLKRREKLEGVVVREGSEPARISVQCLDDVELKVILRKQ